MENTPTTCHLCGANGTALQDGSNWAAGLWYCSQQCYDRYYDFLREQHLLDENRRRDPVYRSVTRHYRKLHHPSMVAFRKQVRHLLARMVRHDLDEVDVVEDRAGLTRGREVEQ